MNLVYRKIHRFVIIKWARKYNENNVLEVKEFGKNVMFAPMKGFI